MFEIELEGVIWRFRWCPSGSFMMGSLEKETQHKVTLTKGFWMGETPVTQEQWRAITGNNPSHFIGAKLPVECVSWNDCHRFLIELNQLEIVVSLGFCFSLPTEAQWEYACRAGTTTAYCFGDSGSQLDDYVWCNACKDYDKSGFITREVGKRKANAWELYDMHGNVWEWCEDLINPLGSSSGSYRVNRGGSWFNNMWSCRSFVRGGAAPEHRTDIVGFRVVLSKEV